MFHAPMGKFQLEFNTTTKALQERNTQVLDGTTSTPTRPVENVVLTTKGLQERNTQLLDGTTVKNR